MKSTFKQEITELMKQSRIAQYSSTTEENYDHIWGEKTKFKMKASASGLEKAVRDFLQLKGHQVAITEVKGTPLPGKYEQTTMGRMQTQKPIMIPSGATKGQADISSSIYGLSVHWEVKYSAHDRQSQEQKKFERDVINSGGFYFIIRSVDDFYEKYYTLLEKPTVVLLRDHFINNKQHG